ncbi:hypothetical protein D3C79_827210 [compost metagenome]
MSRTKQLAAVVVFACALATNAHAQGVEGMSGSGSWLQLSSKSLLHGTKGNARVVVRNGNRQASLDAPYEVVRTGEEGGTIKLRTSCGPMSFLFTAATNGKPGFSLDAPDVHMLERKAGVSRCGLGDRINLGWHLMALETSE